jgi:hypothetical protein
MENACLTSLYSTIYFALVVVVGATPSAAAEADGTNHPGGGEEVGPAAAAATEARNADVGTAPVQAASHLRRVVVVVVVVTIVEIGSRGVYASAAIPIGSIIVNRTSESTKSDTTTNGEIITTTAAFMLFSLIIGMALSLSSL